MNYQRQFIFLIQLICLLTIGSCTEKPDPLVFFKMKKIEFDNLHAYLEREYILNNKFYNYHTITILQSEKDKERGGSESWHQLIDPKVKDMISELNISSIFIDRWLGCKGEGFDQVYFRIEGSPNYYKYNYCPSPGGVSQSGKVVGHKLGDNWYYVEDNSNRSFF